MVIFIHYTSFFVRILLIDMHYLEGLDSEDRSKILTKFKQKRFEEIISIISEKIKINPNSGPLYHLLGLAYISVNSIEDAITFLELALKKMFLPLIFITHLD